MEKILNMTLEELFLKISDNVIGGSSSENFLSDLITLLVIFFIIKIIITRYNSISISISFVKNKNLKLMNDLKIKMFTVNNSLKENLNLSH